MPAYLISDGDFIPLVGETDDVAISGPPLASVEVNGALMGDGAPPPSPPPPPDDEEEYIPSDGDGVDDSCGCGGSDGVGGSGGCGGSGNAIEEINQLDQETSAGALGFNNDDYMWYNTETGYWEPDPEKLEEWEEYMLARANILACLLLAISNASEMWKIADETISGVPIEEGKNYYKEAYARKIRLIQKICRTAIAKLFEYINAENKKLYDQRIQDIEDSNSGSGADTENFCTGGASDIEATQDAFEETYSYLQSTKSTLEAMQEVIEMMIEFLKATLSSGDVSALTTIKALQDFSAKLDELNAKVDDKLEETKEKIDELSDASTTGWFGFVCAVLGNWGFLISNWIMSNAGPESDFADGDEFMEEADVEMWIEDYRGSILNAQNGARLALSMQLFKSDLWNTARQEVTGLSGIGNDAEIVMQSVEATFGHVLQVFDSTASQMMLKTGLHNNAIKQADSLQQLRKAQGVRLVSFGLSMVILALSIVITALTFGSGAPLILVAVVAILAIAKALMDAYAIDIASDVPSYNPVNPHYDANRSTRGGGTTMLDALDDIEAEQDQNMADTTNTNGLLGQTDDELYYLDSVKFAVYELKQKIMDNAIRTIFAMMKNIRDMQRVVKAEMSGAAPPDSGDALLQNAVENILLQKQLILSAIKFMHQQVIDARNITKQREIAQDKAWECFGWSLFGSVVGFVVGGAVGGLPGAMLGVTIGSTLASSIYQYVQNVYDHYWDMDINAGQSMKDLEKMLSRKGEQSVEARLDQAELAALQELMANGIVGTGDGYSGVDFGLAAEIYDRLGKIYAIKEIVAKMRAFGSELRAIVKQQMTGITLGKSGELMQAVNQANFSTTMKVAQNLVQFLATRSQVLNRARDAEKARDTSLGIMIANIVLAVVSFVLSGVGNFMSNALCTALASVGAALMSLVSSLASLITNIMTATGGLGSYENYDARTTVNQTGNRVKNGATIDQRLDELEYEIMCAMSGDMISTYTSSFSSVSPAAAQLSSSMRALYNVREALAMARSIASSLSDEVRAQMSGKRLGELTYGIESIENREQVAMSVLDSLKSALDTICERQNRMAEAELQIVVSAFQTAFSLASVIVSCVSAAAEGDLGEMDQTGAATNTSSTAYSQVSTGAQAPATPGAPTGAPGTPTSTPATETTGEVGVEEGDGGEVGEGEVGAGVGMGESGAVGATGTMDAATEVQQAGSQAAEQADQNIENNSQETDGDRITPRDKLEDRVRTLRKVSAILGMLSTVTTILIEACWKDAMDYEDSDSSKEPKKSEQGSGKGEKRSSEGKNTFSSMDSMDARIAEAEYYTSVYQVNQEAMNRVAQRCQQLTPQVFNSFVQAVNTVKAMHTPDINTSYSDENLVSDIQDKARTQRPEATARFIMNNYADDPAEYGLAIQGLQQMDDTPRDVQRATDVLEQVSEMAEQRQMTEMQQRADAAIAALQAQVQAPTTTPTAPQVQQAPASTSAALEYFDHLITQRQQQIDNLEQQQAQLAQEMDPDMRELEEQTGDVEEHVEQAHLGAQVEGIMAAAPDATLEQIPDLQARLEALEASRSGLLSEQTSLVDQKAQLELEMADFNAEVATVEASLQGDLEQINLRLDAVRSELAGLEARQAQGEEGLDGRISELRSLQEGLTTRRDATLSILNNDLLQVRGTEIRARLTEINGRLQAIRGELVGIQQSINHVRGLLETRRQNLVNQAGAVTAPVAPGGTTMLEGTDIFDGADDVEEDDLERAGESVDGQPGSVHHDGGILLAIAGVGLGAHSSDDDRHQYWTDVIEDEGKIAATTGAGVSC
ncbi:MAG: hypothetical protein PHH60_00480 [Candidatus Margulisbacteria bacterium]|nr:hypothetical protein [Candidatus Margulisiibacteriota bacterium]